MQHPERFGVVAEDCGESVEWPRFKWQLVPMVVAARQTVVATLYAPRLTISVAEAFSNAGP